MIDNIKYKEVLDSGLLLDHYMLLIRIKNGEELASSKRVQGFINLLTKKEYLTPDQTLTEKAEELITNILPPAEETTLAEKIVNNRFNNKMIAEFSKWSIDLHKRLQDRLVELTGKKQVSPKIERKSYSFLCNATDLGKGLWKTMAVYKIDDREKIEKTLMAYIDKCNESGMWFPILIYYINKFGVSQLVTDMENLDDATDEGFKSSQKFA
jgi:hypothetical protein